MIETKKIRLGYNDDSLAQIEDAKSFGWQETDSLSERHGRHTSHYKILARETTMKNYNAIRRLEINYDEARSNIKYKADVDGLTALLLFLLFIIPGVLYLSYKSNKNKEIKENNDNCHLEMQKACEEAKKLL